MDTTTQRQNNSFKVKKSLYWHRNILKRNESIEPIQLTSEVLGNTENIQTWQMKHGISSERHAKIKYKSILKSKHTNMTFVDEPGMTISTNNIFVSVSPDLEIDCKCHGPGVVEIKCPASIPIGCSPCSNNYKHLEQYDNGNRLKKTSEYYFQIQGQMAVTKRLYGHFFVFSLSGYHLEQIEFDEIFWLDLLHHIKLFWKTFIFPERILGKVKKPTNDGKIDFQLDHSYEFPEEPMDIVLVD